MKRTLIVVLIGMILTVFSMLIPLSTPVHAESYEANAWAVIIGVSDYEKIDDVQGNARSAQELFELLCPIYGREHIKLLLDRDATKSQVRAAIEWLVSNEDATDTVLFYFAGHGAENGAYIAPCDAYYTSTWISTSELGRWLGSVESDSLVIILDTCHAGRFETRLGDSGRVILMSSRADEVSWVFRSLSDDWYSVFTYYLIEAIRMFDAADTNHNYGLSAEEMFWYAETKTTSRTSQWDTTQHPAMSDQYPGELTMLVKFVFDVNPSLPQNYDILTIDRRSYSYSSLPFKLLCRPGSTHDLGAVPQVDTGKGTRYRFASWSDGNRSVSRTISHGGVYRANYKTEHELVIESAYGKPRGEGWYEAGSTATISVEPSVGSVVRQVFTGWSGDFSGDKPTAQLVMNSPRTITANWQTDYTRLHIIVAGSILVLIGLVLAMRSHRKQENWYLKVLKRYAVFSGRASRKEYWLFFLFNAIFLIVASIFDLAIFGIGFGLVWAMYALAVLIPGLAVLVRRLHDVGKSGWFVFIVLIPIGGPIWLLVLTCLDSQPGDNKYGPNPKEEQSSKAIADYSKAIELAPGSADAYYNRGDAHDEMGDYGKAIADYNKAIELAPDSADAYYNRGDAYDEMGDYGKAIADYNKAIQLDPNHASAYYQRGCAYGEIGAYDKAIADFNKAIELNPNDSLAYYNRGLAYSERGEVTKAVSDLEKCIELSTDPELTTDARRALNEIV